METVQRKKSLTQKEEGNNEYLGDITLSNDDESSLEDYKANGTLELETSENESSGPINRTHYENGVGIGPNSCAPTDLNFEEAPVSSATKRKIKEIEVALSEKPIDRSKLQSLAKSERGLVNDELRKQVWPKLLGVDTATATAAPSQEELEAHEEYQQVVMDVNRSLKRFPPGIPYDQRVALQDQLTRLILRVIIKYPHLRYYQGYHDVAVTFLLVVGEADAFQIMEKLSTEHLKDCMEPTMDKTCYLLNYIYPLIRRMNPSLHEYIERANLGTTFCVAWFLTWYGHSLNQYHDVVRLYDYFLASPPLLPLYLAATLVVHRQDEIFDVECDLACIHSLLSKIPDDLPFELLLKQANTLYQQYPPQSIEVEVRERFQKELQMRRASPSRHSTGAHWRWQEWNRFVPQWIAVPALAAPRIRYRVLLVTATLVGLYAYLRMADAVSVDDPLPVR